MTGSPQQGAKVIEIDTDGIYFHPPAGAKARCPPGRARLAVLPAGIEVEFDARYRSMFSYKAKNYALLEEDGTMHLTGAALKSRGMEPFLRDYMEKFVRLLLEAKPLEAALLKDQLIQQLRARTAHRSPRQDRSPAGFPRLLSEENRRLLPQPFRRLRARPQERPQPSGDQISYYITGTKKKVVAYESARLIAEWNPAERDENVEYYVGKLEDLAKKFGEFASTPPEPELF